MVDIDWREPPPDGRDGSVGRPSKWAPIAEELKKKPGEWARLKENVRDGTVTRFKNGTVKAFAEGFEVVSRRIEGDNEGPPYMVDIYARYVGDAEPQGSP